MSLEKVENYVSSNIGARKAALFLSTLDARAAETLLNLFEPEIAKEIAEEAKHIHNISVDEVENIVAEFLQSIGMSEEELSSFLQPKEDYSLVNQNITDSSKSINSTSYWTQKEIGEDEKDIRSTSALNYVSSDILADLIKEETASIYGIVLSMTSKSDVESVLKRQSRVKVDLALRLVQTGIVSTPITKQLEDALFERALEDDE